MQTVFSSFCLYLLGKVNTALFPGYARATHIKVKSLRVDSWGRGEVSRTMMFFELMETAQAFLVSFILTDGSAQAVFACS